MATQLDLQEQEQLDALKAFWSQYGNLILTTVTLALLVYAGWMGWNWWQRDQAGKASALYEQFDQAAATADVEKIALVNGDLQKDFGQTVYAAQASLTTARALYDAGKIDEARASLEHVVQDGPDVAYRDLARLRLAELLADRKDHEGALKLLDAMEGPSMAGLAADLRGDILMATNQRDAAITAYKQAWDKLDPALDYRRIVDAKLTALASPPPAASGATP